MLTVLMPSRGRERQAREAYDAFRATKVLPATQMLIVLTVGERGYADLPCVYVEEGGGMGAPLNAALVCAKNANIVGFVGRSDRSIRGEVQDLYHPHPGLRVRSAKAATDQLLVCSNGVVSASLSSAGPPLAAEDAVRSNRYLTRK